MPLYTITYLRATVSFPSLQKVRFILWKRQNTRSLGRRTQITVGCVRSKGQAAASIISDRDRKRSFTVLGQYTKI